MAPRLLRPGTRDTLASLLPYAVFCRDMTAQDETDETCPTTTSEYALTGVLAARVHLALRTPASASVKAEIVEQCQGYEEAHYVLVSLHAAHTTYTFDGREEWFVQLVNWLAEDQEDVAPFRVQ